MQLANEGHFGSMVNYQNYQVRHVPIAEAVNRLKLVPPNGEMVQTARDVDIFFRRLKVIHRRSVAELREALGGTPRQVRHQGE